ncbi:unnamed protein product, partial [Ixodes persulcatus]
MVYPRDTSPKPAKKYSGIQILIDGHVWANGARWGGCSSWGICTVSGVPTCF